MFAGMMIKPGFPLFGELNSIALTDLKTEITSQVSILF
jgi:hypothetical protein